MMISMILKIATSPELETMAKMGTDVVELLEGRKWRSNIAEGWGRVWIICLLTALVSCHD